MTARANTETKQKLDLQGLDGSNPLAFLAAIGTHRLLSLAWPRRIVKMSWEPARGAWRPVLTADGSLTADDVIDALQAALSSANAVHQQLAGLGDNLNVSREAFRKFASQNARLALPTDRALIDFVAAFGCEAMTNDKGDVIQDTAFRTMSGGGHQHFLGFMRNIAEITTPEHLQKALFRKWTYDDPVEKLTMRWDPADDSRYALQWRNPSGDPRRKAGGSMLGANRLAIEGLPLFPTAPDQGRLLTTGFTGRTSRSTYWTWPLWQGLVTIDVVRSLLALAELQQDEPDRRELLARGIVEVYRSQRLTTGKYRNFSPSRSI